MPLRTQGSDEPRIGITGGPGVGKSTVLSFLREAGYSVVSADDVARSLVFGSLVPRVARLASLSEPFTAAELRARLFPQEELPDGSVRLLRRRMNALLHGPILEAMIASRSTFWEVPLLVEAGLMTHFDEIWAVTCSDEEQRRRLFSRYSEMQAVDALIASQLPSKVKKFFSHREVRTDTGLDNVRIVTLEHAQEALADLA